MPYSDRKILLACSEKKRPVRGPIQAVQLYDGPLWRDLRQAVKLHGARKRAAFVFPFVIVLSAKHGFIHDATAIEFYEQELTPSRAEAILADAAMLEQLEVAGTAEVFLAGGKLYRQTMRRALDRVGYRGAIVEPAPARGIGDIRAAMARFIEASPPIAPKLL